MSSAQTALSWANYFTMEDFVQNRMPGFKDRQIIDNWTIIIGANDRSNLLGPSMTLNIGANYSTSYDLVGYFVNNYLKADTKTKTFAKLLFGSGDIKMAFGPSTSLLYGGPGGSSKRGPYWDRIAGTWLEPRAKGAKYSAEGSFSPQAVDSKGGGGLQFFERDQIFGENVPDGGTLGIMIRQKKRWKKGAIENLDEVKINKYDSDIDKCYTEKEMTVLKAGDKAARVGTIALALLDLTVSLFAVLFTKFNTSAGVFVSLDKSVERSTNEKIAKEQRDLDQTKIIIITRLAYKTAKILTLQLMEIFENTERLARQIQENIGKNQDKLKKDYFLNNYLGKDQRRAIEAMEKDLQIPKDDNSDSISENLELSLRSAESIQGIIQPKDGLPARRATR